MAVRSWATCHHRGQEHLSAHGSQVILSCINHVPVKHSTWLDRRKLSKGIPLRDSTYGSLDQWYFSTYRISFTAGSPTCLLIDILNSIWAISQYHTPPVKENGITLKAHQNLSFLPLLILKNRYVYLDEFVCVVHVVGGARAPPYTCGDEGLASGACWLLPPYGMWGSNGDYQVCQKHLRPLSHPIGPVSLILVNGHLSSI